MSERKSLLFFLFSENKKPYYLDKYNRVLEADADWKKPDKNPAHLDKDPETWRDTFWKYARNPSVWGVFRDFTAPLNFVEDGKEILRYLVWGYGVEAKCYIAILKLDRSSLPYSYKNVYNSELDFTKYLESRTSGQVEALEGGPSKYWKAKESNKYTVPVDANPNHVKLFDDGIEINNTATLAVLDGTDPTAEFRNHLVNLQVINREVQVGGVYDVPRTVIANDNTALKASGKYLMDVTADGTLNCEWDFTLQINYTPSAPAPNPALTFTVVLRVIHKDGTASGLILITRNQSSFAFPILNKSYHVQGTGVVNVVAGDQVFLYTFVSPTGATGDAQCQFIYGGNEPFIKMGYVYRHPASYVSCLTALELGKQLVKQMSNGECDLVSTFLSNLPILYSPADAVRGLANSEIVITWKDFYQSLQQFGVMMFFEGNNFRIEAWSTSFQTGTAIHIGSVKDAKIKYADDLTFQKIKVGGKKQEYKEINGRYEFNQPQEWELPFTRTDKELDLTTPCRTDAIGAEILRINFDGKTTTDSDSDNDTFMFAVVKTPDNDKYEVEERIIFDNLSGNYDVPFATSRVGSNFKASADFTKFTYIATYQQIGSINLNIQLLKEPDRTNINVTIFRNTGSVITSTFPADGNTHNVNIPFITFYPGDEFKVDVNSTVGQVNSTFIYAKMTFNFTATYIYKLLRPAYSSITGIGAPNSVYNTTLRPKQSILNNGSWIHSIAEKYLEGKEVKFDSGDGNTDLATVLNGVALVEKENIPIKNLNPILFLPWYIIFTTEILVDLFTLVKMNTYQRISFEWNDKIHYGFLWDGGVKLATEDAQQWTLLAAPETDLKNFNS